MPGPAGLPGRCASARAADVDVPAGRRRADNRNGAAQRGQERAVLRRQDHGIRRLPFHELNMANARGPKPGRIYRCRHADGRYPAEKNATVVIHEYATACANALFVATHETHLPRTRPSLIKPRRLRARNTEATEARGRRTVEQFIARVEELCGDGNRLYRKRGISDDFTAAQTPYS